MKLKEMSINITQHDACDDYSTAFLKVAPNIFTRATPNLATRSKVHGDRYAVGRRSTSLLASISRANTQSGCTCWYTFCGALLWTCGRRGWPRCVWGCSRLLGLWRPVPALSTRTPGPDPTLHSCSDRGIGRASGTSQAVRRVATAASLARRRMATLLALAAALCTCAAAANLVLTFTCRSQALRSLCIAGWTAFPGRSFAARRLVHQSQGSLP
jgi:hypothetical protein